MKLLFLFALLLGIGCKSSSQESEKSTGVDTVKGYWPDGSIQEIIVMENGLKNGPYFSYFPTGELREKAFYVNNKGIGSAFTYFKSGKIETITYYDKPDYIHTSWYDNGNINQQGGHANGKMDGKWIQNYRNGQLRILSFYAKNVSTGVWKYYTYDGELYKEEIYRNDTLQPDKDLKAEVIEEDTIVQSGWKRFYYKTTSSPSIEREDHYSNGMKNGYSITYFESQEIKEIACFKKNRLNGKQMTFYPNRYIESISFFKDGEKVGKWIYYDKSGNVVREEEY